MLESKPEAASVEISFEENFYTEYHIKTHDWKCNRSRKINVCNRSDFSVCTDRQDNVSIEIWRKVENCLGQMFLSVHESMRYLIHTGMRDPEVWTREGRRQTMHMSSVSGKNGTENFLVKIQCHQLGMRVRQETWVFVERRRVNQSYRKACEQNLSPRQTVPTRSHLLILPKQFYPEDHCWRGDKNVWNAVLEDSWEKVFCLFFFNIVTSFSSTTTSQIMTWKLILNYETLIFSLGLSQLAFQN